MNSSFSKRWGFKIPPLKEGETLETVSMIQIPVRKLQGMKPNEYQMFDGKKWIPLWMSKGTL